MLYLAIVLAAIVIVGAIDPSVGQRIDQAWENFLGATTSGPAKTQFNLYLGTAIVGGGLAIVYFVAQAKVARHEGIEVGKVTPQVQPLPQYGGSSGVNLGIVKSESTFGK